MPKCIVVEDDPFWSAEITAALSLAFAEIEMLHAANGRAALDMARRHPDASMVLDIILAELDGVEVLQQLRLVAPNMAVLAITGGGRLGAGFYLRLAEAFGARARLAKPFTAEQLVTQWASVAA